LTAGFVVSGALYYQELKESIKKEKQSELATIADFKVQQIGYWRRERYADAVVITQDEIAASRVKQWFQNPVVLQDRTDILGWLASIAYDGQCRRVYLIDESGTIRLSTGKSPEKLGSHVHSDARAALRTRRIIFGDFEREDEELGVHLDLFAPMYLTRGRDTTSVAVILLQLDPQEFFFQLVKSWPLPSRTSEVVLFRREADSIVFLTETNDLKHRPLSLRLPITQNTLPAVKALKGEEGIIEGIDYAGVPVLTAIRRIPDSPWIIVVKVSFEEMYAPLQDRKFTIVMFVGALIIAAGSVIGMVWRHQRALFYRRRYELELERKKIQDPLSSAHSQLRRLSHRFLQIQENERRAIARELHDEIGQILTATKINLEVIRRNESSNDLALRLDDGIAILDECLQKVRNLSLDLRPSILDDLGLVAALRWQLERLDHHVGLEGRLIAEGIQERFDPDLETACFRIAQEALTNIAKHAKAHHLEIELKLCHEGLALSIRDDGVGFDVDRALTEAIHGESFGILGIQERVTLLNGKFEIKSTAGMGTIVTVRFPLRLAGGQ
jgi:signal transduction histidine kinase